MKTIEPVFAKNANGCGKMTFTQVKKGTNPAGRNVYIYRRDRMNGDFFSYELFIAMVKKAGTYKVPTKKGQPQKYITYDEDFEQYPGASLFGRIGWEIKTLPWAEHRFQELTATVIDVPDTDEEDDDSEETPESTEPKHRGRPKKVLPEFKIPEGEFSVKELAASNGTEYVTAYQFMQQNTNLFVPTRTERRAARGPETQLYKKA
jgi:hypothetical protein